MTLANNIKERIESHTAEKIDSLRSAGGGCISDAQIVKCKSGVSFFLKINNSSNDMFKKEANGLKELKKADAIRVPDVIMAENNFILLENIIPAGRSKSFFEEFGEKFAKLHKYTSAKHGFYEDNYIGSTNQVNLPLEDDWKIFYWEKRILFQVKLCEQNGYATDELRKSVSGLENKLDDIMADSENTPSLLHGDLWNGNFVIDDKGEACLIDPAVYYGNREADLAMTKLFGGFNSEFYQSYRNAFPLPAGYEIRENFYKLYHVLNHLNIFGRGYYSQAISLIKYYL
ncbi:MAG: fructosamine kinase family protein [Ignavibacteriaceae bacterium]